MTLIDRRILISAPVEAVWKVIADHNNLPRWRGDCKAVSILSTRSEGIGVRRRITPPKGKDYIEALTVWYDGLGYEYQIVEGSPFKSYTARTRLQATPDGTIMQWTILFQSKGLLARLFGNRRKRRQLSRMCESSLRRLRRYIDSMDIKIDDEYRKKAGVQAAPDVDARRALGEKLQAQNGRSTDETLERTPDPRPVSPEETPAEQPESVSKFDEPPVRIDDTPSVPSVTPPSFIQEELTPPELKVPPETELTRPEDSLDDTRPNPVVTDETPETDNKPAAENNTALPPEDKQPVTPPPPSQTVNTMAPIQVDGSKTTADTPSENDSKSEAATTTDSEDPRPDLPAPTGKRDTGEISIWDAFGIKREEIETVLTETGQMKAVNIAEDEPETGTQKETATQPGNAQPVNTVEVEESEDADSLEEWLATNEPPLPAGASGTVSTLVRVPENRRTGLRKRQRLQRLKVRMPHHKPKS